jgi:hypothetical protein
MYEMEGASPGYVALGSPVARFTWRYAPPAGPEFPRDVPVSQYFPRPGVTPGRFPFPTVKVFLLLSPPSRKGLREFILGFFGVHTISTEGPRLSARCVGYPPAYAQLIHKLHNVIRRVLI